MLKLSRPKKNVTIETFATVQRLIIFLLQNIRRTTPTMNFPVELLKINSHLGLVKKNNKRQSSLSVTPSHNRTHPMVGTKSELN